MLTPAKEDPNRDAELKRKNSEPTAFGTNELQRPPKDWNPDGALKPAATDKQPAKNKQPKS